MNIILAAITFLAFIPVGYIPTEAVIDAHERLAAARAAEPTVGALTILKPSQGGTGIGSATAGDVGDCIAVTDDDPFTYAFTGCAGGPGGGDFPFTARSYGVSTSTTVGFLNGMFSNSSTTLNGNFTFGGVTGNSWDDYCTAITGGAGLCDGSDASGAGGSGSISTSSVAVISSLAYFTTAGATPELVSPVATTTLTASSPLSLSNPVAKVGGSNSVLTISTTTNNLFSGTGGQILAYTNGVGYLPVSTSSINVGTASALLANGANCSAGQFPLGVDASGAVETCTDAWTEAENTSAAYAAQATTLTIAGTANQITSSAGAQSLASNRTWTLSLPNTVIFPIAFNSTYGTTTFASSTALTAGNLYATTGFTIGGDTFDELVGTGLTISSGDLQTTLGVAIDTTEITDDTILETDLNVDTSAVDGDLLTYDSTGTNFDWITCAELTGSADLCDGADATGGAGGANSKWATSTNLLGIHPNTTSMDVWLGNTATSGAPFWFDVSATTSYIGTGGPGDSDIITGPAGYEWIFGFDDTDDSFAIASSTALGTTNALTIAKSTLAVTLAGALTANSLTLTTDLSVANGGTGLSTFGGTNFVLYTTAADTLSSEAAFTYAASTNLLTVSNATTTSVTVSQFFQLPNGATQSPTLAGACGYDTTSGQFKCGTGSATEVIGNGSFYPSFFYATTTTWTGTTTIDLGPAYVAETWNGWKCFTDAGFLRVNFHDGTNRMNDAVASATVGTVPLSTNNTFTAGEKRFVDVGTTTTSVAKRVSCTVDKSITAD